MGFAKQTMVDWANFCREVLYDYMITKGNPIGGPGATIEIDESKFGKRKYHRGRIVDGQWVFGMLERETGSVVMVPVENRTEKTLLELIKKWILPGSTIMSDCWWAYCNLSREGYNHLTVNHSINFTDPISGANTNRIESSWRAAKHHFESSGRRKHFFAGYLAKYMFIKQCKIQKVDPFERFWQITGNLYSPRNPEIEFQEDTSYDELEDLPDNENDDEECDMFF